MESQTSRENINENHFALIIQRGFIEDKEFLIEFSDFKESKPVPRDVTWEMMKKDFNWGYLKGSIINPLITWIYLRPDIKKSLDFGGIIKKENIAKKLKLNEHYFISESKAIEFLLSHSSVNNNDDSSRNSPTSSSASKSQVSDDESSEDFQSLKRKKRIFGIDDAAVESKKKFFKK